MSEVLEHVQTRTQEQIFDFASLKIEHDQIG